MTTQPSSPRPLARARILIADDEPAMVRTVEHILAPEHRLRSATSPLAALAQAETFDPDLAIIDIRMPEMDGFELMNELKKRHPQLRVILMTGSVYDIDDKLIRAIREKAFYYITKPFDRGVLRTLVDRCLELRALEEANRRHVAHLESQLADARAFQETMLPAREARLEGFDIRAAYRPCVELAGDLYDYAAAGDGRIALLIADVVGHGVSAAMLTSVVKSAFQASYAEAYEPRAVVRRVAEGMAAFEPGRFVTLLCVRISVADGTLEYVNAGHEGGLVATPGRPPQRLATTGPLVTPLLVGQVDWEQRRVGWDPASVVLLYTDGIPEAEHDNEAFEIERLHHVAEATPAGGAALLEAVLAEVERFIGGRPAADDMTLLTARHG